MSIFLHWLVLKQIKNFKVSSYKINAILLTLLICLSGLFCSAGAGWYFLYFLQGTFGDVSSILANFGVDMGPGWSFYLCCAAGGASLILSIILMVIGCNMPSNNGMVAPLQPTNVIAVNGGQMQHQYPSTAHNMQNPACNDPFDPNPKQGFY